MSSLNKAFSSRSNQESPVPNVVSNNNSALPPPPQQQPPLSGVAAAFQPPIPRSHQQQNQQSPSPTQQQQQQHGVVPSYNNHNHHHHHNNHYNNNSNSNNAGRNNNMPSPNGMHQSNSRGGFSGNYNNNNNQGSPLQHGGHHHNNNNNNNRPRNNNNKDNSNEEPTGTTGMPTDLAANVEVYAHGQDKIFTIPREDIISLPAPTVAGGNSSSAVDDQEQGGAAAATGGANQQQNQQKLQLCPTFDPENPEESCPLGARCRFVHARVANAPCHDIHCNYAYANPEDCKYECYPAGELLRIAPPNSNAATDDVPSNYVLKTRALQSSRRVISHCAHYYFNRICNRGSECFFIHAISIVPKENGTAEENMYRRVWGRTQHRGRGGNNTNGGTSTPPPGLTSTASGGGFPRNDSHGNLYNGDHNHTSNMHGGYSSSYSNSHLAGTPPRGTSPNEQGQNLQFPSSNSNSNLAGSINGGVNFNHHQSNSTPTPPNGSNPTNAVLPTSLSAAALQQQQNNNNNGSAAPPSYFSSNNNNTSGTPSKSGNNTNNNNNLGNFGQQQQGVSGPALSGRVTPPPLPVSPNVLGNNNSGNNNRSPGRMGMNKSPSMSNMAQAYNNNAASPPDTPSRNEFRRMNDPYSNTSNVRYVRSPVSHQPTNGDQYGDQ